MNHRATVKTENLKPFKKGYDPRRGKGGKNAEAQAFAVRFRNALAEKISAGEMAELLIAEAKRKRPWAIQEILDRLMGKSTQPIEHKGEMTFTLSDKFLPEGSGAEENDRSKPK